MVPNTHNVMFHFWGVHLYRFDCIDERDRVFKH